MTFRSSTRLSSVQHHASKQRRLYSAQPWVCVHHPKSSEIKAYVEASGEWETVCQVQSTSGVSAETAASFIIRLINDHQQKKDALRDAMQALEMVMKDGLTFSTEQSVEVAMTNAKRALQ